MQYSSLALELLGWETPSLALANSLFLAWFFILQVHWTVLLPSQSRENNTLHAQGAWLNFAAARQSIEQVSFKEMIIRKTIKIKNRGGALNGLVKTSSLWSSKWNPL